MILSLASLGVFVSLPVVGAIALGGRRLVEDRIGWIAVVISAGLAAWSVPLLGLLILGAYSPPVLGAIGWVICGWWMVAHRGALSLRMSRPSVSTGVLIVGLAVAFLLYASLPADPVITARDMGVYAAHGAYIAEHGRLDVPYPIGASAGEGLPGGWIGYAGIYPTEGTQTVQFGHLYPAWLAQAFAVGGFDLMIRVNGMLAVFAAMAVYGLARRWIPAHVAVLAALVLALNASQVWVARNTLTETMTQLFIWSAFLLLVAPAEERWRASLIWAGLFVGIAAVVRIDSLVMLPLFLAGWAVAWTRGESAATPRDSVPFFVAASGTSAVAVAYYLAFSNPYFTALWPEVRLIALAAGAGVALCLVVLIRDVRTTMERVLASTPFLAAAVVGLLALAAFAYFIRPGLEPFALLDAPGHRLDGTRSYVEDAMFNTGQYLGPPTIWLAVFAWLGMMVVAIRSQPRQLPFLVVVGGYASLYFWNQSIFPDHFWAVRRFIPVIIPAAVILAGVGGWYALRRFPSQIRPLLFGLAVLALAAQTWRVGTPLFFVADRSGSYKALAAVADAVPDKAQPQLGVLSPGGVRSLATPLYLMFDVQVPAVDATRAAGRDTILAKLATASVTSPVSVITNLVDDADVLIGKTLAVEDVVYEFMQPTTRPVRNTVGIGSFALLVKNVVGVRTLGVRFGARPSWLAPEAGFHGQETSGGQPVRWTDGNATIRIPVFGGRTDRIRLDLASAAPGGTKLRITVQGRDVAEINVPSEGWSGLIQIPLAESGEVTIELASSTFVPAEVLPSSNDTRVLGVMVRGIILVPEDG